MVGKAILYRPGSSSVCNQFFCPIAAASGRDEDEVISTAEQIKKDQINIAAIASGLTVSVSLIAANFRDDIEDVVYSDSFQTASDIGAGDVFGAMLWSLSLYYCSPVQLLLLFLGKIETERPSDWILYQVRAEWAALAALHGPGRRGRSEG